MNHFDFDTPISRKNTTSLKWDVAEGELPMWVADMDFCTAPAIQAAIEQRVKHGIFGYSVVPEEWRDAIVGWWERRHDFHMEPDWLIFCTGVVPAISSMVRKLTTPAEKVVIQTPVYNIFFNSIYNNGRYILESPLRYENGQYTVDFADLEEKLADPQTTLMILCNPHNPIGKIWERETLERIGSLCKKHHVTVIADEIHCDITDPGQAYIPFASAAEDCREISITCIAPTKTFNIAGLQTAAVCIPNPVLRHKVNRGLNTDEIAEPNAFAIGAAIAAYTKGAEWLDALREYLYRNKQTALSVITNEIPNLRVVPGDATYLLWLDCTSLCENTHGDATAFSHFLRRETGLFLTPGEEYGQSGKSFLRMNIACPRAVLKDGLRRLARGVRLYRESAPDGLPKS